jgi:hypothetical protein
VTLNASCSTCVLRPKEDGGKGGCSRTESYPILKEKLLHDCPLFRREPMRRLVAKPLAQDGLF